MCAAPIKGGWRCSSQVTGVVGSSTFCARVELSGTRIGEQAAPRHARRDLIQPFEKEIVMNQEVILKRFEQPDEVRVFPKGRFEIIRLGGVTLGRATYEPGWKWSTDVGAQIGAARCEVEHVGWVLSGVATAAFEDGTVVDLRAGELFHIPPVPHDSWVVGEEPYVSLHFLGAEHYASK
jgi:hypothetical protein